MLLYPIAAFLERKFSSRLYYINYYTYRPIAIGTIVLSGCTLLCSMTHNPYLFIFLIATGLGVGAGLGYVTPITLCVKYFPQSKSVVSGFILCGYGLSAFIFSFLALAIVNPHNKSPTIVHKDREVEDKYYTSDVYDNVNIYIYIYRYQSFL